MSRLLNITNTQRLQIGDSHTYREHIKGFMVLCKVKTILTTDRFGVMKIEEETEERIIRR